MPFGQHIILAVGRQFEAGKIFRCRAQARGDKNHAIGIDGVNRFDRFIVDAVEGRDVVIQLVRRLVDQVKPEQRRAFLKVVRHSNPPVHHLFFVIRFRVVFVLIRLIGNDRDHAVLVAGFHQFAQVNQPRFGRLTGHANPHMGKALGLKITHFQRVELTNAALGARPVDVDTHAELLRVARSRQRRLSGKHPARGENQRSGDQRL
ncbi:hypothetical protein LJPFL01_0025 [Lelliottia jeotgali]|nr:hypothetical protein LJPFL01_0025 [Lelliottia jeotgali]